MSLILDGSNGITFPNSSTQAVGFYGFKNRIINGAMVIDQRNAGASVSVTTDGQYVVDRFDVKSSVSSKLTAQQNAGSVTTPTGFNNYLGLTSTSAYSVSASDYFYLEQRIEAYNVNDLAWGTANAKTVNLSFWVYSSLTGTFGGSIFNGGANRSYPYIYTITSANTWQQISVTIPGDTSGTWSGTNGIGMLVTFGLGVGSTGSGTAGAWAGALYRSATGATSVVGTNGATFYITGVQLEAGSTATSFDYRPYGTELALCQRYYVQIVKGSAGGLASASSYNSTRADGLMPLPVPMRSTPSFSVVTGSAYYRVYLAGTAYSTTTIGFNGTNTQNTIAIIYNNTDLSGVTNGAGWWDAPNANAFVGVTAEL